MASVENPVCGHHLICGDDCECDGSKKRPLREHSARMGRFVKLNRMGVQKSQFLLS